MVIQSFGRISTYLPTRYFCVARLISGCMCALLLPTMAFGECVKHIAWADNVPYLYKVADGSVHGLHADLVRETLKRMDCKAEFVEMPWARSLVELQEGRVDMLPGTAITPERQQYALFSRQTNDARNVLFVRRDPGQKVALKQLSDIIGTDFHLGVTYKAYYGEDYENLSKNPAFAARVTQVTDRMNGWKMIAIGRLDGKLDDEITGLVEIKRQNLGDRIVRADLFVSSAPDYVAFSRKTTTSEFVDQFNSALNKMIEDGSYKQIFEATVPCKLSLATLGCEGGLKF